MSALIETYGCNVLTWILVNSVRSKHGPIICYKFHLNSLFLNILM